jgi:hypothetical protein
MQQILCNRWQIANDWLEARLPIVGNRAFLSSDRNDGMIMLLTYIQQVKFRFK